MFKSIKYFILSFYKNVCPKCSRGILKKEKHDNLINAETYVCPKCKTKFI